MAVSAAVPVSTHEKYCQETMLLSPQECADVCKVVFDLREMWVQRNPPAPFYTLGLSTYMDACDEAKREFYYATSRYHNLILSQALGWMYIKMQKRLSEMLCARVRYRRSCALPGFHIFTGVPERPAGIHIDRQHHHLAWAEKENADLEQTISLTMSLRLPRDGRAGLNVWNNLPDDTPLTSRDEWVEFVSRQPKEFIPYHEGSMVLHDGSLAHQMSLGDVVEGGERITLQGHGVNCNGVWELYW